MRKDSIGLFWQDTVRPKIVKERGRMPPIPETGWAAPTEFPNLSAATIIGFDVETYDPELINSGPGWARGKGHLIGASLAVDDGTSWYFPMRHETQPEHNMDPDQVTKFLSYWLEKPMPKVGANLIYDVGWCRQEGIKVGGRLYDVQFAEALLNSETPDVSLEALAQTYLGTGKESNTLYAWLAEWFGGQPTGRQRKNLYLSPPTLAGPYAEADAALPIQILRKQWPLLHNRGVLDLFDIECRLIPLLVDMRFRGAPVDVNAAEQTYEELGEDLIALERRLKEIAGQEVNPNAAQSIKSAFIANSIKIPTKLDKGTGQLKDSFSASLLETVDHPLCAAILEHRRTAKVRNTFVKSYIIDKNVNGRIYCSFHPLRGDENGARSGRYSCVAAWTAVLTKKGEIPISQIVVGDEVWTNKNRWRAVIETQIKPADQMYNVHLTNGKILTCTAEHKVLTTLGWRKVGEIYAALNKMGNESKQYRHGFASLPRSRLSDIAKSLQNYGHTFLECSACYTFEYAKRRIQSFIKSAVFRGKAGQQQSDDRQGACASPQLDWRLRGRSRIFDACIRRWGSLFCASNYYSGSTWNSSVSTTAEFRNSSYRYQHTQQRHKQPCAGNASGTRDIALVTRPGEPKNAIVAIQFEQRRKVYDITVADDHSYFALGVCHHNSSDPNLQNIPIRSEIGKKVRRMFRNTTSGIWVKYDFSQIEYRMLAHHAVGPGADGIRLAYRENPDVDFHQLISELIYKITGIALPRRQTKGINFGLVYGMGKPKLLQDLITFSDGGKITRAKGLQMYNGYHESAPFIKATMEAAANEVHRAGYVETILGRKSDFNGWTSKAFDASRLTLEYRAACAKWGPYNIERANVHKALNRKLQGGAADVMKKAMVDAYEAGLFADDLCGMPCLTVHDELDFDYQGGVDLSARCWAEFKHIMENAVPAVSVPIRIDSKFGANWADAD